MTDPVAQRIEQRASTTTAAGSNPAGVSSRMEPIFQWCIDNGYRWLRLLPTGEWIGVQNMLFTTGLFVGVDAIGWRTRFCFETPNEAIIASLMWDGAGWPPGYWIKQKPEGTPHPLRPVDPFA